MFTMPRSTPSTSVAPLGVAAEGPVLPRYGAQGTGCGVGLTQGLLQGGCLSGVGTELDLGDQRLGHGPSMRKGTDIQRAVFGPGKETPTSLHGRPRTQFR